MFVVMCPEDVCFFQNLSETLDKTHLSFFSRKMKNPTFLRIVFLKRLEQHSKCRLQLSYAALADNFSVALGNVAHNADAAKKMLDSFLGQ